MALDPAVRPMSCNNARRDGRKGSCDMDHLGKKLDVLKENADKALPGSQKKRLSRIEPAKISGSRGTPHHPFGVSDDAVSPDDSGLRPGETSCTRSLGSQFGRSFLMKAINCSRNRHCTVHPVEGSSIIA